MDPRVKFISGMPLVISIALLNGITGPAVALALGIALALLARLDAMKLMQRLLAVNAFIFMLWFFLPFTHAGQTAFSLGPLTATREGMAFALMITLKANAIALISIAVFGTSEAMSLAHALLHIKVPLKLVYLFFFFYRYLSVLHQEYTRLRCAMRLRSFRAKGTTIHTYRNIANLVGMLLVRSSERSVRIYNAMLCRGFKGHFPVSSHFHLHTPDLILGPLGIIITGGFLILWR